MRLFVAQDGSALRAVLQDGRLDPGLTRPESGDHAKLEYSTSASPGGVQCVRGLRRFRALRGRRSLKVAPGERPSRRPRERMVLGQIAAQEIVERTWPRRTWGGCGGGGGGPSRRKRRVAGAPERRAE